MSSHGVRESIVRAYVWQNWVQSASKVVVFIPVLPCEIMLIIPPSGTGEFAQGQVDPHEAGKAGGHSSGGSSESTGSSGGSGGNGREYPYHLPHSFSSLTTITEFAGGKVDPVEAGKKGGQTSH